MGSFEELYKTRSWNKNTSKQRVRVLNASPKRPRTNPAKGIITGSSGIVVATMQLRCQKDNNKCNDSYTKEGFILSAYLDCNIMPEVSTPMSMCSCIFMSVCFFFIRYKIRYLFNTYISFISYIPVCFVPHYVRC